MSIITKKHGELHIRFESTEICQQWRDKIHNIFISNKEPGTVVSDNYCNMCCNNNCLHVSSPCINPNFSVNDSSDISASIKDKQTRLLESIFDQLVLLNEKYDKLINVLQLDPIIRP